MQRFFTSLISLPDLSASCRRARFSSSAVMANQRFLGMLGAWLMAIMQLVLHGLPMTRIFARSPACSSMALPCPTKIPPLTRRRSLRSIPAFLGAAPTSRIQSVSLNATPASEVVVIFWRSGKAQSSNSILTPSSAGSAGSNSKSCNSTLVSGPKTDPDAILNKRAYPI